VKISYKWLCEYLKEKPDFNKLVSDLSRIGFSIDDVSVVGADTDNVVTAKVLKKEKHPNADRLSVCEVFDGKTNYTVVCGAPNVCEGQVVCFARVGSRLKDITLKKAKIRGVESNGMICSGSEIGIEEKSDGILVLPQDTPLGIDLKQIFPLDYVFELEITPNLGYCLSHYALARELSIFYGYGLNEIKVSEVTLKNISDFPIKVETENCYRYTGVIVKGIKNLKTPSFIYERLKKVGLNPKDNILIDVSNYVMFEIGQPTHCFDLKNLTSGVRIRMAFDGEAIKALDGNDYKLSKDIMVISDFEKPVAIAGVIGGWWSSINPDTRDIFIEVANFNPQAIRKSSKYLNIKTDSSYRFERGVDIELCDFAAKRMIDLIKINNPDIEVSIFKDIWNADHSKKSIKVDHDKINLILGTSLPKENIDEVLEKIDSSYDGKIFTVPSYRRDIENIWDISEEVARYLGYDVIQSKPIKEIMNSNIDPYSVLKGRIISNLKVFGVNEVINYDLVSESDLNLTGYNISDCIKLENPLSKEFEYLRPDIIISLLKNVRHNVNRGVKSLKIIEFGTEFIKSQSKPLEKRKLAGVMCGLKEEILNWNIKEEKIDFFYVKSFINYILGFLNPFFIKSNSSKIYMVDDLFMSISVYGKDVGFFGMVNPDLLKIYDISKIDNLFYFNIDMDILSSVYKTDFISSIKKPKMLSPFPFGIRDLSFIVDKKYTYQEIYDVIKNFDDIVEIRLIDVYEDEKIGKDKKSFTFRFYFSSYEKTFTDEELNKKIEEIFGVLEKKFSVKLR